MFQIKERDHLEDEGSDMICVIFQIIVIYVKGQDSIFVMSLSKGIAVKLSKGMAVQ